MVAFKLIKKALMAKSEYKSIGWQQNEVAPSLLVGWLDSIMGYARLDLGPELSQSQFLRTPYLLDVL